MAGGLLIDPAVLAAHPRLQQLLDHLASQHIAPSGRSRVVQAELDQVQRSLSFLCFRYIFFIIFLCIRPALSGYRVTCFSKGWNDAEACCSR